MTASDSTGWVYDPDGIDVAALKEIKEVNRARLTEYKKYRPNSEYPRAVGVWSVKVDIALPCATQNELHLEDAKMLVENGCFAVAEGANMPTTMEATQYLQEHGVLFAPGKAANAGGVGNLRAGDVPEQRAVKLDLRRSRQQAEEHYGEHLPQYGRRRRALRHAWQLCGRRQYRGI